MTPRRDPRAVRLYRRALVVLPRRFRRLHGAAMVAMLADEWRESRGLGRGALLARALADLLWTAVVERARPLRGSRGRPFAAGGGLGVSWLDLKLAVRMLVRYPGLTVVGALAMAFALCVGAATFEFLTQVVHPSLPVPEGDRVVALQYRDVATRGREAPSVEEFLTWRDGLATVEAVGAYRIAEKNLVVGDGAGHPVRVAEVTASALEALRVPPRLGRPFVEADERPGAPRVALVGDDVWRTRFGADPDVVGRTVRLAGEEATVVGVMPPGFGFPLFQSFWVPLRPEVLAGAPGPPAAVRTVGRLAPGANLEAARAELATWAARRAADAPDTHAGLRAEVVRYPKAHVDLERLAPALVLATNLFIVLLLVLVCGNVALLTFARAATRRREIVVRNALGASRGRIVGQLFVEALALGAVAAVLGLAAAGRVLAWSLEMVEAEVLNGNPYPFWIVPGVTPDTVAYGAALTVLAAVVAGVVPGLQVTGRGLAPRLQAEGAGGGGPRMGRLWTAVIVIQVALTVVFPATAFLLARGAAAARGPVDPGFPVEDYLTARLEMDAPGWFEDGHPATRVPAELRQRVEELERRLEAEPAVLGVTYADRVPRMYHPWNRIEVDEGAVPPADSVRGHRVADASVAPDYFDVLGVEVLSGRGLHSGDLGSAAPVVLVNRGFVEEVLGGKNPLGRRVRYRDSDYWNGRSPTPLEERPWYEIVGVVPDLGMGRPGGIYHPAAPEQVFPLQLAIHVRGEPEALVPRLRALATDVDPRLRLYEPQALAEADFGGEQRFLKFWFRMVAGVGVIASGLALTGIYSVLSFTVARRTREIGVRVALGARAWQVVLGVFRRPLLQVGTGLAVGTLLTSALLYGYWGPDALTTRGLALLAGYAALMTVVCATACLVPARRALRVQPTEALVSEG